MEYNHFEIIYHFMERNLIRERRAVQCVLFTLENYTYADEMIVRRQLEHLHHAIVSSLRKGDVTTKYSLTQMLVLLMDANTENAGMVAERILCKYRREAGRDMLNIRHDIRQVMCDQM